MFRGPYRLCRCCPRLHPRAEPPNSDEPFPSIIILEARCSRLMADKDIVSRILEILLPTDDCSAWENLRFGIACGVVPPVTASEYAAYGYRIDRPAFD